MVHWTYKATLYKDGTASSLAVIGYDVKSTACMSAILDMSRMLIVLYNFHNAMNTCIIWLYSNLACSFHKVPYVITMASAEYYQQHA